jgi:hypothetical protein
VITDPAPVTAPLPMVIPNNIIILSPEITLFYTTFYIGLFLWIIAISRDFLYRMNLVFLFYP